MAFAGSCFSLPWAPSGLNMYPFYVFPLHRTLGRRKNELVCVCTQEWRTVYVSTLCYTCWCSRVCDCAWVSESEGGGRGNSPALPSDCVQCYKGVQPSPVGVYAHSKGPGEGNHPASVTHTHPHLYRSPPSSLPPMLYSIPQTQSQIATRVPHYSSSSHFDHLPSLLSSHLPNDWCEHLLHPHSIIHPFRFFSPTSSLLSGISFSLLFFRSSSSLLCFAPLLSSFPPPGTFLLCLFSKALTS